MISSSDFDRAATDKSDPGQQLSCSFSLSGKKLQTKTQQFVSNKWQDCKSGFCLSSLFEVKTTKFIVDGSGPVEKKRDTSGSYTLTKLKLIPEETPKSDVEARSTLSGNTSALNPSALGSTASPEIDKSIKGSLSVHLEVRLSESVREGCFCEEYGEDPVYLRKWCFTTDAQGNLILKKVEEGLKNCDCST